MAHLLNVIGKEGQEMFETFALSLKSCRNSKRDVHVIYKRYTFNKRTQEPGEFLDHYLTEIIKQAGCCQLKDELVRYKLVSGIQNDRIREKLIVNLTQQSRIFHQLLFLV